MKKKFQLKIFDWIITAIIVLSVLVCILPIMHEIAISLSSKHAILSNEVLFFPVEFSIEAYKSVLGDLSVIRSLFYTVTLTLLCVVVNMVMTICCAYPLAKKRLNGRKFFLTVIIITMYFSGGMIPNYLLVKELGLLDTTGSLVLPGLISAFNMFVLKSFFEAFPESLEESAYIDGYSDIGILIKIVLPLSMPALATLSLFYAVSRWNGFMDALFYITNQNLYPLQLKLYNIIYNSMALDTIAKEGFTVVEVTSEALKAATVMVATIPIILVYPWLQKYFVKGVMVGAVKG